MEATLRAARRSFGWIAIALGVVAATFLAASTWERNIGC